jgi:hypothetical protein
MNNNRFNLIGFLVVLPWLLAACGPTLIKDATTRSYVPIQGWTLELRQDVTIPPNRTRVFFQEGRVSYGINEYEPHCQLRVRKISEQPQSVRADRFSIENVFGANGQIVSSDRIQLAAAGAAVVMGGGDGGGDGPSQLIYFYFMGLHADKQPNVTYLVCGGALNDAALARYPTIQDIRTALGDYATLIIPGGS